MKFRPPRGMRDLLPVDALKFESLIELVRSVFKTYGFRPLITPAVESFGLLSAKGGLGEAVRDEIYYFKDKAGRELGLRFDLTMPLARVLTTNLQLQRPFKRYAIGRVWRYDEPQAFRWREFWQADIDVVGSNSLLADTECLAATCDVLTKLGFKSYFIRINNRKLVQSVLVKFVPKHKMVKVFRIIDKLDRIGIEGVRNELRKAGINPEKLVDFLSIKGSNEEILEKAKEFSRSGLDELNRLLSYSNWFGISDRLRVDPSLVRGLEYYTSLVFEVNLGLRVSCGGGGRYDNLMKAVGGVAIPATGISLGLNRIFEVMQKRRMLEPRQATAVFIASTNPNVLRSVVEIAQRMRREGITCEFDLMGRKLKKQLEYASKLNVPYVIVVGEREVKSGRYKLKLMEEKTEKTLRLDSLIRYVKGKLE